MQAATVTSPDAPRSDDVVGRLLRAWLLTALVDGLFSSVLSRVFYGSTVTKLWLGVASGPLGPSALQGGTGTALVGVAMHFVVALTWSSVFLFGLMRFSWVRELLASRYGVLKAAALYGPCIWMVMSLVLFPPMFHRPTSITNRWWIQFFGHIPFVALPMITMLARRRER